MHRDVLRCLQTLTHTQHILRRHWEEKYFHQPKNVVGFRLSSVCSKSKLCLCTLSCKYYNETFKIKISLANISNDAAKEERAAILQLTYRIFSKTNSSDFLPSNFSFFFALLLFQLHVCTMLNFHIKPQNVWLFIEPLIYEFIISRDMWKWDIIGRCDMNHPYNIIQDK